MDPLGGNNIGVTVAEEKQFDDALLQARKAARKDGVFAGLSSGLASAIIGGRFMALSRNKTIFCGVATGLISGYLFTQAFTDTAVARVRAERTKRSSQSISGLLPSIRSEHH
jgi:hypothetical protein